jgi:ATP-dependent DNA ligase
VVAAKKVKARFIEPMLLLRTEMLPEGPDWLYEIKFDGYRALAIKTGGKVQLRTRNDNDFSGRYPGIAKALGGLPDETVIDGEVAALDASGKPSFNTLQNHGSSGGPLHFYLFDLMVLAGRDVMREPFTKRRELLEKHILPKLSEPIRYAVQLDASLKDILQSMKAQGLEGLVAKRANGKYEPGERSGAWQKMRVNQGQELEIAGYTPAAARPGRSREAVERAGHGLETLAARPAVSAIRSAGLSGVPALPEFFGRHLRSVDEPCQRPGAPVDRRHVSVERLGQRRHHGVA